MKMTEGPKGLHENNENDQKSHSGRTTTLLIPVKDVRNRWSYNSGEIDIHNIICLFTNSYSCEERFGHS